MNTGDMMRTARWIWFPLLAALLGVALADHYTGWAVRFTFFYGALIAAITVLKSKLLGLLLCPACGVYSLAEGLAMDRPLALTIWNAGNEVGALLLAWFPLALTILVFGLDRRTPAAAQPAPAPDSSLASRGTSDA